MKEFGKRLFRSMVNSSLPMPSLSIFTVDERGAEEVIVSPLSLHKVSDRSMYCRFRPHDCRVRS